MALLSNHVSKLRRKMATTYAPATSIRVDDPNLFTPGDMIEIPRTGERFRCGLVPSIQTNVYNHSGGSAITEEEFNRNILEPMSLWRYESTRGPVNFVKHALPPLSRRERLLRWLEPKAAWVRRNGRPWLEGVATRLGWVAVGAGWGALAWSAL